MSENKEINEMIMRPDMLATDVDTVLDAREAVEKGLIDIVGGLSDALLALQEMIKNDVKQFPEDHKKQKNPPVFQTNLIGFACWVDFYLT